jgi:hypothetical protein
MLKVLLVNFGVVKVRVLVVAGGLRLQEFKDECSVIGIPQTTQLARGV